MDLNSILAKTKSKSEKIKKTRPSVNIATDDRPYDIVNVAAIDKIKTNYKPPTKNLQTDYKEPTNYQQTKNKVPTQPATNQLQTSFKVASNQLQTANETTYKTDYNFSFSELVGIQRDLMIILYQDCKKNGEKITAPLSLDYLISEAKNTIKSIKTSIYRLEKKLLISRFEFKNGRGGWTRYQIPDHIYKEIFQLETTHKLPTNYLQSDNKVPTNVTTKLPTAENHYNSSSFITTIGEGWDEIDCSPLEEIGFGKNCLKQLKDCGADLDVVQISINYYAFERNKILEMRKREEKYPLKIIMGVLRKGNAWSKPSGYISPQEQAIRRVAEEKKREREAAEVAAKELFESEFKAWEKNLSGEGRAAIAPGKLTYSDAYAKLRAYFMENQWQEIKKAWS